MRLPAPAPPPPTSPPPAPPRVTPRHAPLAIAGEGGDADEDDGHEHALEPGTEAERQAYEADAAAAEQRPLMQLEAELYEDAALELLRRSREEAARGEGGAREGRLRSALRLSGLARKMSHHDDGAAAELASLISPRGTPGSAALDVLMRLPGHDAPAPQDKSSRRSTPRERAASPELLASHIEEAAGAPALTRKPSHERAKGE